MIRLGIISDSHNAQTWVERWLALANRQKYDAVFHLGDGQGDAKWLGRRLDMPLIAVAGNCDYRSGLPGEALSTYGGHRLLAVHGHRHDARWGLEQLSYYAESRGAGIALFGHTHEPVAYYVGPVMMINPGALLRGCYAELTLDGRRIVPSLLSLNE